MAEAADPDQGTGENIPLTSVRGLAASAVFVAHIGVLFWPFLPRRLAIPLVCGWMGVDLFFVLSGFILASVYANLTRQRWGRFWLKRVLRVYPLNTAILALLVMGALAHIDTGADADWRHLPWHLLAMQSFVPHHKPGWIFVNWSVGVEVICYIAFPLLALGLQRLGRTGVALAAMAAAALTVDMQLSALAAFWGLHAVMRCGSEFLLGAAAGTLALRAPLLSAGAATCIELGALAAVAAGLTGGLNWDWCVCIGSWRMATVPVSFAVMIFALASDRGRFARLLHAPALHWLGRVSFSLYMIHEPLLRRLAPLAWLDGRPRIPVVIVWSVASFALALALASVTYRLIELPGRRLIRYFGGRQTPPSTAPTMLETAR